MNIACEGLLLLVQSGAYKDTPIMKLYLTPWTFTGIMTVSIFIACFAKRDVFT
jgi:hypothetical protein